MGKRGGLPVATLTLALDPDAATSAIRARQTFVRIIHRFNTRQYGLRHRCDLGAGLIDVQREGLACSRQPAVVVPDFLIHMKAFFVIIQQLKGDLHGIIHMQFAHITDVEFGDIGGAAGVGQIVGAKAEDRVGLVGALIHQDGIIGHVEVAIVVDPFGAHGEGGGAEGGICHGVMVSLCAVGVNIDAASLPFGEVFEGVTRDLISQITSPCKVFRRLLQQIYVGTTSFIVVIEVFGC